MHILNENEVLIIPDVHGRSFWKEPCNNWRGDIVFLGDYHDPYYYPYDSESGTNISPKTSLKNLKDLVKFYEEANISNRTIIFLIGNHDLSYLSKHNTCRYDYIQHEEVEECLNELPLQFYVEFWNKYEIPTKKYLFSHAGITPDWLDKYSLNLKNLNTLSYNDKALDDVPYSRGGDSYTGSCVWISEEDYKLSDHLPEYYQIFGHTWGGRTEPVIKEDYAMLDCCKPFILNMVTGKIREYGRD